MRKLYSYNMTNESYFERRKRNMTYLLEMNDSTMRKIFGSFVSYKFTLTDQHNRVKVIGTNEWVSHLRGLVIDMKNFNIFTQEPKFMEAAKPYVEYIKLQYMTKESLEKINRCKTVFAKVKHLEFQAQSRIFHKANSWKIWRGAFEGARFFDDESILKLVKMFPNVTRLTICNYNVTGKQLAHFQSLEHLTLIKCCGLDEEGLYEIFAKTKLEIFDITHSFMCPWFDIPSDKYCPTLEYIRLDVAHLNHGKNALMIMAIPSLSELSVKVYRKQREVLEKLIQSRIRKILCLSYSGSLSDIQRCLMHMSDIDELKTLILQSCVNTIKNSTLLHISKRLQNLCALHVTRCSLEDQVGLLYIITNCHKLTRLDVSYTKMDNYFIERVVSLLELQLTRTKPLEIWTYGSKIRMKEIERFPDRYSHKMLKIDCVSKYEPFPSWTLDLTFGGFL